MAVITLDTAGLKCPQPILKMTAKSQEIAAGDILEVIGDCPTFEKDVRAWCQRLSRVLLSVKDEGGGRKRVQIQF